MSISSTLVGLSLSLQIDICTPDGSTLMLFRILLTLFFNFDLDYRLKGQNLRTNEFNNLEILTHKDNSLLSQIKRKCQNNSILNRLTIISMQLNKYIDLELKYRKSFQVYFMGAKRWRFWTIELCKLRNFHRKWIKNPKTISFLPMFSPFRKCSFSVGKTMNKETTNHLRRLCSSGYY